MTVFYNLNRGESVTRMEEIQTRMEDLAGKHRRSTADESEFDELRTEFDDLKNHVDRIDRTTELARAARGGSSRFRVEAGSPRDQHQADGHSLRDNAMRLLDGAVRNNRLPAHGAEVVEGLMHSGPQSAQTWTQRYTLAAGSEHYERAFAKKFSDPDTGHLLWTNEEAEAWRTVATVAAEERAMSTTDSAGGYLSPLVIEPSILLTSSGSISPLRQISRNVTTISDAWQGVTSAGVVGEWLSEASQAADASPTVAQPSIPVYKASAFVPYSYEIGDDATNFMVELAKLLIDSYDQLTATAFTTGSGSGQPTGLITKLVASSGTVSLVAPAVAESFTAADIYATQLALPPRFQARASWNAALGTIQAARQFESTNGAIRFPEMAANPPQLLGRPLYENSAMDGSINPAASENNYSLCYGDFSHFVIVSRIGSRIEPIQNLVGANHRPTGQRGAFLWARVGSDVVVPQAFRLLSIPTTA